MKPSLKSILLSSLASASCGIYPDNACPFNSLTHFAPTFENLMNSVDGLNYWIGANAYQVFFDYSYHYGIVDSSITNALDKLAGFDYKGDGNIYVDDRAWKALAALRGYEINKDQRLLDMAKFTHAWIKETWSSSCGGGVTWTKGGVGNTYKNTIANALFFELSAKLHLITTDPTYKTDAVATHDWLFKTSKLYDGKVFVDGINSQDPACAPGGGVYSYQIGVVTSALTTLYKATLDQTWLTEATSVAVNSIPSFTTNNVIREADSCDLKGASDDCGNDGPLFKGVYVRGLKSVVFATNVNTKPISDTLQATWTSFATNALTQKSPQEFVAGLNWLGPSERRDAHAQIIAMDLYNALSNTAPPVTGCLYEDLNFAGRAVCYRSTGYFDVPWNDEVSSLKVSPNCLIKLAFDGALQGKVDTYNAGDVGYVGDGNNDRYSSLEIDCT